MSPRQSRHKCICGILLQNEDHEHVTPVDAALKTISSLLTTALRSRLRLVWTRSSASTFSTTLRALTTWTPVTSSLARDGGTTLKDTLTWKRPLYCGSLAWIHVQEGRLSNEDVTPAAGGGRRATTPECHSERSESTFRVFRLCSG